jgi:hypothetical protein
MFRDICGMVFVVSLICMPSVFADEHLLFYANFDEDVGNEVKDHSQYGNDGELREGAKWSPDGKYGGCAEIREHLAHVNVVHNDLFNVTDTITMEAWVNPDEGFLAVERGIIVQKVGNYVLWFMANGQVRVADDTGEKLDTVGYPFEAGKWYHIAGILDTRSPLRQIYVNGELVAEDEVAFDMVTTTQPLQMGRKETDSTFQYRGSIDEVRVWDVVRTAEEIKQDMEGPLKAVLPAGTLTTTWGHLKD